MKTIGDALDTESDNFLLLRFLAASLVIYGHGPGIAGGYAPEDVFVRLGWGEYSGSIAVDLFFIISGFLVTGSLCRRRNVIDFLWARFLRVVPAYGSCLLLCAMAIGPILSVHSSDDYFLDRETYRYVWKNLQFGPDMACNLPGVFIDNPTRATVNGSIWTLPAEVRMYAWVAIFGLAGALRRTWLFNIALLALFLYGFARPSDIPLVPLEKYVRLAALFGIGGFCHANRAWIPVNGSIVLAAGLAAWALRATTWYPAAFAACETLFVFWFAYGTRWRGFNRFGDYSYGIYLWAFPMQQVAASLAPSLPSLLNTVAGFVGALPLAVASWHLIEKPALRLKQRPYAETPSTYRLTLFPTSNRERKHGDLTLRRS